MPGPRKPNLICMPAPSLLHNRALAAGPRDSSRGWDSPTLSDGEGPGLGPSSATVAVPGVLPVLPESCVALQRPHDPCLVRGAQVVATFARSASGERRRESAIAPAPTSSDSESPAAAPIAASPQSKLLSGLADGVFGAWTLTGCPLP